jgi:hypothetical protein
MYPKRVGGFLYGKYICCTYYMATEIVFANWVLCLYLFIFVFIYYFLSFLLNFFITYRLHFSLLHSDIRAWNRLQYAIPIHVRQYSGGWPDTSIFCEWLYLRDFVLLFHLTAPRFLSLYGVDGIWTNHMCEYEKLVDLHRRGKPEVLRGLTCPAATFSTTNSTFTVLGWNSALRGECDSSLTDKCITIFLTRM